MRIIAKYVGRLENSNISNNQLMTIQVQEIIKIDGEFQVLLSRPFEPFLKALEVKLVPISTACWRGYIGTWELVNNVLYLTGIKLNYHEEDEEKLIPLKLYDVIYQATWYTGELKIGIGRLIYIGDNYQPLYEKEMICTVEGGLITNHDIVKNKVPKIDDDALPF